MVSLWEVAARSTVSQLHTFDVLSGADGTKVLLLSRLLEILDLGIESSRSFAILGQGTSQNFGRKQETLEGRQTAS